MPQEDKCVLCGRQAQLRIDRSIMVRYWNCDSCGTFGCTEEALDNYLRRLTDLERLRIAACTRERTIRGSAPLTLCASESPTDESAANFAVPYVLEHLFPARLQDRLDRVLLNLCSMTDVPGKLISLDRKADLPVLFAESVDAGQFVLQELQDLGYLTNKGTLDTCIVEVRGKGLRRAEELEESEGRKESVQAFVAMWFHESLNDAFTNGIVPAVERCGFTPLRIDAKETNQKICDEIVAEIRRSRFLIADCTGQRGGVYFEAGFALGLGIPVIWTCRKDEEAALHFDTRQYAHILWEKPEDLLEKLTNRIAATIPGAKLPQR